jgi:tRNA G46 methylase TrmB
VNQPSQPVTSRQTDPHPRLEETVLKHLAYPWRKPVAAHNLEAFRKLERVVEGWKGQLVLDTGCGTGLSSIALAHRHPEALVLGLDKSLLRLEKHTASIGRYHLERIDLEDFWPLARQAGWKFAVQAFFYPNPWPKPEQRLRRWAFHPVFPDALACGGLWELRTNWEVYALEMARAFAIATGVSSKVTPWCPHEPETLFEAKYLANSQSLYRWTGEVPEH